MSEPTIDFAMKPATEQGPVALPGIQSSYLAPANNASATASGGGGGTRNTTLPGAPSDGQVATLTDSLSAPTYNWAFVWETAASAWLFAGGSPATVFVDTSETTVSTTYAALSTAGPSFTVPNAGVYLVRIGCHAQISAAGFVRMSFDVGGTAAVDLDAVELGINATGWELPGTSLRSKTCVAGNALVAKYKTATGTGTFAKRWLQVTPVSVT